MYAVLIILAIIICILLILAVLIQNPKGGGISPTFGGFNQVLGAKKSTDVIEKSTWYLAGALLFVCLLGSLSKPAPQVAKQDTQVEDMMKVNTPSPGSGVPIGNDGGGQQ